MVSFYFQDINYLILGQSLVTTMVLQQKLTTQSLYKEDFNHMVIFLKNKIKKIYRNKYLNIKDMD